VSEPTDEPAFLKAILANRDDDLPRLVFADWLDERNGPRDAERAEFIRVQVELAKIPVRTFGPSEGKLELRHEKLRRREKELWATMVDDKSAFAWCKVFGDGTLLHVEGPKVYDRRDRGGADSKVVTVSRGFPELVTCTLADWCGGNCWRCAGSRTNYHDRSQDCPACHGSGARPTIGPTVVAAHPVTRVTLSDREPLHIENRRTRTRTFMWLADDDPTPPLVWEGPPRAELFERHRLPAAVMTDELRQRFASAEEARDAVSERLIAWAKEQNRPKYRDVVDEQLRNVASMSLMPSEVIS